MTTPSGDQERTLLANAEQGGTSPDPPGSSSWRGVAFVSLLISVLLAVVAVILSSVVLVAVKSDAQQGEGGTPAEAPPFKLDQNGTCSGDAFTLGGMPCFAPWVYCTDARCDSNTKMKDGVLVAECLCWMPNNTNFSIIPKRTSGAACVAKERNPVTDLFKVTGGEEMCQQMKDGALISTYGPTGKKPPARAVECSPKTEWAWCWGAPCHNKFEKDGTVLTICDCPIMISDYATPQYVSVSVDTCADEKSLEEDPCRRIHNGSPAGGSPMKKMPQCNYSAEDVSNDYALFPESLLPPGLNQ